MVKGNKLARIVASIALPIIGSINVGCEMTPAQEMAIGGVSAQHVATTDPSLTYQQSQSLGAIGGLLGILSQQEARKEAAREGRTQVNVNVTGQNKNSQYVESTTQTRKKIPDSFVFNYKQDINKDDILEHKEIKGLNKTIFSQYELIYVGSCWFNCFDSVITSQIKDEWGEILDVKSFKLKRDNSIVYNLFESRADLPKIHKIHKFTSEWYKNGKQIQEKTINFFIDYNKKWEEVPLDLRRLPKIFFCNKFENIDDKYARVEEYKDLRKVFNSQEEIYALCVFRDKMGERGNLNIVSLDNGGVIENYGEIVEDSDNLIRNKNWFINYKLNAKEIKEQLGGNSFRADWYSDEIKYNSLEFKILDE